MRRRSGGSRVASYAEGIGIGAEGAGWGFRLVRRWDSGAVGRWNRALVGWGEVIGSPHLSL